MPATPLIGLWCGAEDKHQCDVILMRRHCNQCQYQTVRNMEATDQNIDVAIDKVLQKQYAALKAFLCGRDVLGVLPTGFGKTSNQQRRRPTPTPLYEVLVKEAFSRLLAE